MHELAVCQAICDTVVTHADGRPVERVLVRIGHLRQVVPDTLAFSWRVVVEGTTLDGSWLDVDHVPAVVHCAACALDTTLDWPVPACGTCGSTDVELRSGEEFCIVSIDVRGGEV